MPRRSHHFLLGFLLACAGCDTDPDPFIDGVVELDDPAGDCEDLGCYDEPTCGPDNCAGCCVDDPVLGSTCLAYSPDSKDPDEAACGIGGMACAACGANESCSAGTCIADSCAATCGGCCDGDTCVEISGPTTCGVGGDACQSCGSGRTCEDGICVLDLDSRWDLVLISGSIPATKPDGKSWDPFNGLPDPFVRVQRIDGLVRQNFESATIDNTLAPVWNEIAFGDLSARELLQSGYVWEAWDRDLSSSELIDRCASNPPAFREDDFAGALFSFACPASEPGGQQLVLRFRLLHRKN
jgi:hypothetical protein